VWQDYRKNHLKQEKDDNGVRRVAGIVIECSSHGNETKPIDDAGWLQAGHGGTVTKPNIESFLVLDLKRGIPTVGFFVTEDAVS
jgi:hypothetical protein